MESIMTIRAPDDLQRVLTQLAKEMGFTRNALVLQILQNWVKEEAARASHRDRR